MAKIKKEIAEEMLTYLVKHYTTDETFTAPELYHIAKKYSSSYKSCTNNQIRNLIAADCVERTEQFLANKHGGSDMPLYRITGKDVFIPTKRTKTAMHYDGIAERLAKMNECQINLQTALNNMTRYPKYLTS